jgi:isorenieratene synthase
LIALGRDGNLSRVLLLGRAVGPGTDPGFAPEDDWKQASVVRIRKALDRALARPSGGWFVVDASRAVGTGPKAYRIAGRDVLVWRCGDGRACAAPEACPHMQAPLSQGRVHGGRLVCPWHGLQLGAEPHGAWRPFPTLDDGVFLWVRLPGEPPTQAPILASRPRRALDAVVRLQARCEPADIIANRLDPWHGVHYHPHSFARLRVLQEPDPDTLLVRVAFRIAGPVCVEVDCTFHSPEPRTIVMTIVAGEGTGSVVETHATPMDEGRTCILEATLATSERLGFRSALWAAPLLRPWLRRRAARLWVEDAAYAERTFAMKPLDGIPRIGSAFSSQRASR